MKLLNKKKLTELASKLWYRSHTRMGYDGKDTQVESGFMTEEHESCIMCGKSLSTETHRRLGIGPECINQHRLKIGILTNRWMDFMTGNDFGEKRPVPGDALSDFEQHDEQITDAFGPEMRDYLAELEHEYELDAILVRPAEHWEEPYIDETNAIPRWRCWLLFRNTNSPHEWRDALSDDLLGVEWRTKHMVDGIWQSHNFVELDTFSTIGLSDMDDRKFRTQLEPGALWWTEYYDEVMENFENWSRADHYNQTYEEAENLRHTFDLHDAPSDFTEFIALLWNQIKWGCGCDYWTRACVWCVGLDARDHHKHLVGLEGGIYHFKSDNLAQKPDYDKLGEVLAAILRDEHESQYGHNPASPEILRSLPVADFINWTSATN